MALDDRCDETSLAENDKERARNKERSRRQRAVRARTISMKRLTKREIWLGRILNPADEFEDVKRPRSREECRDAERPCPFVSCEHHLYLDVLAKSGSIKLNFPDVEADELEKLPATCALDVADLQGVTLEEVGRFMNMTRERVRQLETTGKAKVQAGLEMLALRDLPPESDGRRHLPIAEQPHERLEWATRSDGFDADHFASSDLDE